MGETGWGADCTGEMARLKVRRQRGVEKRDSEVEQVELCPIRRKVYPEDARLPYMGAVVLACHTWVLWCPPAIHGCCDARLPYMGAVCVGGGVVGRCLACGKVKKCE